jgi:hypothetical protein
MSTTTNAPNTLIAGQQLPRPGSNPQQCFQPSKLHDVQRYNGPIAGGLGASMQLYLLPSSAGVKAIA